MFSTYKILHCQTAVIESIMNCAGLAIILDSDEIIMEKLRFNQRGCSVKASPYHLCRQKKDAREIILIADKKVVDMDVCF